MTGSSKTGPFCADVYHLLNMVKGRTGLLVANMRYAKKRETDDEFAPI